jgi:hypothetical protein
MEKSQIQFQPRKTFDQKNPAASMNEKSKKISDSK